VDPVPDPLLLRKSGSAGRIELGTSGSVSRDILGKIRYEEMDLTCLLFGLLRALVNMVVGLSSITAKNCFDGMDK
jgi:hypothetical protein